MVARFFGMGGKKEEPKPQQAQPKAPTLPGGMTQQDLQQQQALARLNKQLAESKEKIDLSYEKVEKQELKIKELIAKGKRTEAKRQLVTFKMLQQELVNQENLVTTLEKAKVQLENSVMTKNMIEALETANLAQKQLASEQDKIERVLEDRRDLELDQKDINNLIAELANGTEDEKEEIDELYAQYEKEVFEDQAFKINTQTLNSNAQVVKPQAQVQPQQQQPAQKNDDLEDFLSQSAQYA